jgi:hypothetical protein
MITGRDQKSYSAWRNSDPRHVIIHRRTPRVGKVMLNNIGGGL